MDIKNKKKRKHYYFFKFQAVPNTALLVREAIHNQVSVNIKNAQAKK